MTKVNQEIDKEDVFLYLDALRDSGQINMMGARPHIQHNFDLELLKRRTPADSNSLEEGMEYKC